VRLMSDRLDLLPLLLQMARDVRRRILAILLASFTFNSVGIALALGGWLTPVYAALGMLLSSLLVIRTSSRAGQVQGSELAPLDGNLRVVSPGPAEAGKEQPSPVTTWGYER
jgi:hypothetical protein